MSETATGLRVDETDAVDRREWEALLALDPSGNILQHPEIGRILAAGLAGARPRWLEVRDDAGRLRGGLGLIERRRLGLARIVSGGAGLYGGPLLDPDRAAPAGALLARAFLKSGGARVVAREMVWAGRQPPNGTWTGIRPLPTSVLSTSDVGDFDAWFAARMPTSRRKEHRRMRGRGYHAGLAAETGFLQEFHPLYAERCTAWGARPLPASLLAALLASDRRWRSFVARDASGELVGAHLCVDLGRELFAWLGTTRRLEGGSAATLLVEAELRWCHEHGRDGLNLGTSADLAGVSEFKRGVSAQEDPRWILRWQRGRGYR